MGLCCGCLLTSIYISRTAMIHVVPALLQKENQGFSLDICLSSASSFSLFNNKRSDFALLQFKIRNFWAHLIHFVQLFAAQRDEAGCSWFVCWHQALESASQAALPRAPQSDWQLSIPARGRSGFTLMALICLKTPNKMQQRKKIQTPSLQLREILKDHMNCNTVFPL